MIPDAGVSIGKAVLFGVFCYFISFALVVAAFVIAVGYGLIRWLS